MNDDHSASGDSLDGPLDDQGPLKVADLAELLSLVPYMIGFPPEHSLVLLGFTPKDDHDNVSPDPVIRLNLAPDEDSVDDRDTKAHEAGETVASVLSRHRIPAVVLVGYGTPGAVAPFGTIVEAKIRDAGVQVIEFGRVQDDRYWSYSCTDSECCPPEGKVLRTDTSAAAQAVFRGYTVSGSREELRARLAPPTGRDGERMGTLLAEAAARLGRETEGLGPAARQLHILEEGERLVPAVAARVRDGAAVDSFDDAEVARFLVLLGRHRFVRDLAWGHADGSHMRQSLEFWCEMARRAGAGDDGDLVSPPACFVAYIALRLGDGALANVALDCAEEADPQYMMTRILRGIAVGGMPPEDIPTSDADDLSAALQREKERLRQEVDAAGPPMG